MSEIVDVAGLPNYAIKEALWRAHTISYILDEHQLVAYDGQRAWEQIPIAKRADGQRMGAARWWVDDWGRRTGKTTKNGVVLVENGMRRDNARMIYATKSEVQMKEILIPAIDFICKDAPPDLRPKFFSSKWGMRAGYHFPANDSVLKLVGLDKDPDGLRGPYLDWAAISEAGFIKDLKKVVGSIVGPQFLRRPWARGYLESSAPEDPDHDFDAYFVEDAKRRKAYWFYTYEDISDRTLREEAELEYQQAHDLDKLDADREYKGIRSRDFNSVVIPEFVTEKFVFDIERPKHAYALAGYDPGFRHLFGAVWAYYDWQRGIIVVQDSWAGPNANTAKVACVTAAREYDLYGTLPPSELDFIPLEKEGNRQGWRDYLKDDRCEARAEELHAIANTPPDQRADTEHRPGQWVTQDRPGQWTYWDNEGRHEYMPNPYARIADVDLKLIADMHDPFGFNFLTTTKEELRTMVNNTRRWFSTGRIVFLPGAGPVIDHVKLARWNPDRKRFTEHKTCGHFDTLAGLIYLTRYVGFIENRDPSPPEQMLIANSHQPGMAITHLPWQDRHAYEIEAEKRIAQADAALEGDRGRMREPPRIRPYR